MRLGFWDDTLDTLRAVYQKGIVRRVTCFQVSMEYLSYDIKMDSKLLILKLYSRFGEQCTPRDIPVKKGRGAFERGARACAEGVVNRGGMESVRTHKLIRH